MKNQIINKVIDKSLKEVYKYLFHNFSRAEISNINEELIKIVNYDPIDYVDSTGESSYIDIQNILSSINEKDKSRKSKGVYYTPYDVVKFIYTNAIKSLYGILKNSNLHVQDLNGIPYESFCYEKSVFDPTCGAGEFLLAALSIKFDLVDLHQDIVSSNDICKILITIHGNDINPDSIIITKLRLLIFILNRYGVNKISGIANELNKNFSCYDFINLDKDYNKTYHIIIGNPPYVEDSKCDTKPLKRYGNVYANVLDNVSSCLAENGVIGFIIPLSYISTPRMRKIRGLLNTKLNEQYILSYCDRPDCLFPSVHQKLCIIIGKHMVDSDILKIYTGNYQFWYKEERENLFSNVPSVLNKFVKDEYIPKIGSNLDIEIYKKVIKNKKSLFDILNEGVEPIYLNMRAAFWIKAFRDEHKSGEYKKYGCSTEENANLSMCILNSSLFWWYWICVSDCWHITNKELKGFHSKS